MVKSRVRGSQPATCIVGQLLRRQRTRIETIRINFPHISNPEILTLHWRRERAAIFQLNVHKFDEKKRVLRAARSSCDGPRPP